MDLMTGNKRLLTYHLAVENYNPFAPDPDCALALFLKVNRDAWQEHEPGSCRVIAINQAASGPLTPAGAITRAEFTIVIVYRPGGWITALDGGGRERMNGWKYERRDEKPDGTPLDGRGLPLPPGAEPVYSSFRTAEWGEFEGVDFGELVGEC